MGLINRLFNFRPLTTILSSEANTELNQILAILNGGIENNNVKPNAGIRQDQGKLVLDYEEIRSQLEAIWTEIDGSNILENSVPLDRMIYAENELISVGIFNNNDPGSFPWTIPAGTFSHFMLAFYGATILCTGDEDTADSREIQLQADSNELSGASHGAYLTRISESGDSFDSTLHVTGTVYIQMSATSNNYSSNPPTLVDSASHDLDIIEPNGYTLSKKHLTIFGR